MAPEQLQGKNADTRTDIFALGAVLYEMVTGKRAFHGNSQISVMSAILEKEPEPISAAQPLTPPTLDHLIRRALEKDPERRWQTAADLKAELKWIAESGSAVQTAPALRAPVRGERAAWITAAVLAAIALIAGIGWWTAKSEPPRSVRSSLL